MSMLEQLAFKMTEYYTGDPARVQHFIKVYAFARLIGIGEGISEKELFTLEAAALVHDIGIKKAEEVYGSSAGHYQEELGPPIAKEMLEELGFEHDVIARVCFLVAHHHTYTDIDGADYRILVEADFLVNLYENGETVFAVKSAYDKIFRTESGKRLCRAMFGIG